MSSSTQNFVDYEKYNRTQFDLSVAFSNQVRNEFNQYSHLWSDIFSTRKAVDELSDFLIAFNEKNTISHGISSALSDKKKNIFIEYYRSFVEKKWLDQFPLPWLGSPSVIDFEGNPASVNYLQNLRLFIEIITVLNQVLKEPKPLRVVEIGAGYGGLAYFLLKNGIAETYTIIDLPENLKLSAFFLTQSFQNKNCFVSSSREPLSSSKNLGLTFVPPGNISSIENWSFDLAINTDSLGEMPAETAKSYIKWIHEHLVDDGCFYTKNGHCRGADCIQFPHEYGYQRFVFKALKPPTAISSLFDDFSHNALLQKKPADINIYPDFYLDCICALYALGLQEELTEISDAYSNNELNEEQKKFLIICDKFFKSKNLENKLSCLDSHIFQNTYAVCIIYLKGIAHFLNGNLKKSVILLTEYLVNTQSYIGEAYSLMIIAHDNPNILSRKYKYGAKTRYALDEILIFHSFSFLKRIIALKLRADILRKKINYPGNYSPSLLLKIKNLIFNFKERREISTIRNVNI